MLREVLFSIGGLILCAYGLEFLFSCRDDRREPRRVQPTIPIPILGHIVGFYIHGFDYYAILR
jgi:hypothetical protein